MIYLASPYSHECADVRQTRYELACLAAARLSERGEVVFSPIAHSHGLSIHGGLRGDFEFWKRIDYEFLKMSSAVIVLMIPGWKESIGVQAEIAEAKRLKIRVTYTTV